MKKIFSLLLIIYALNSDAQSILRLINNTNKDVYSAIAHYDANDKYWVCEGWYKIEPYTQKDIDFGIYTGRNYIHGEQSAYLGLSEISWGDGYRLCVNTNGVFTIRDADHVNCDTKKDFSERRIDDGINKWEFNPK